jgi:hypothetical protein
MPPAVDGAKTTSTAAVHGGVKPDSKILLRNEHFTLLCNVLGHTTQEAQAAFVGMGWRALNRARADKPTPCGEKFVANTLAAFAAHADRFAELNLPIGFDALFEVITPDTETESAA